MRAYPIVALIAYFLHFQDELKRGLELQVRPFHRISAGRDDDRTSVAEFAMLFNCNLFTIQSVY
jgi:hypothetical protein